MTTILIVVVGAATTAFGGAGNSKFAPPNLVREGMRTLNRIVPATAMATGGLMGLVAYWIG